MKCPVCWTEKAYRREVTGLKWFMLKIILLVPMRCNHCYHKFHAFYPLTWGGDLQVPTLKVAVPHEKLASRGRRSASKQKGRSRTVTLPAAEQPVRRRRSA